MVTGQFFNFSLTVCNFYVSRVTDLMTPTSAPAYPKTNGSMDQYKSLKNPTNFGKVIIKGKRMNRGEGYGLEIPCLDEFRGDRFSYD